MMLCNLGTALIITETEAVAGLVSAAPVAVKEKVVLPGVFKVNGIPVEFTGFPVRVMDCPFSVRLTELEF